MLRSSSLALVLLAWPTRAAADVLPEAERPHDWEPRDPPTPAPPPEKELPALALWLAALAAAALVAVPRARLQERPR
ncbi:hypothetical protein SAMN02745121_05053 [Nannocystis exedens]|uniref:MYXO-CTERM domain-containing protein n=1 Tax=Nannocystis exedens TaxID=54 RepID=A0A1I2CE20_9BACT|nr:hypothetical protein [Nannocystis exedens]PCC68381.1 hypothetical protein NAEX_01391 [Nannocystis exedens]SFE65920.1 hypothetical protein SAMN02745121_05053 [Nannocystis exedens]